MKRTGFSWKTAGADLPASIVVFLVALPLCLGIALASNAPLFSGIIAGIVGGVVIGSLSGSQLSVSGPAAGLTAIVAAGILKLPTFETFLLSVFICGALQIGLGFIKAAVIGDYVPNCVIKGMLAAIGLILILNQVPHLLGDDSSFVVDETIKQSKKGNIFSNFFYAFTNINRVAMIIGVVCLAFTFLWEKIVAGRKGFIRFVPAPLLVVLMGVGINMAFGGNDQLTGQHLVNIPKAENAGEFFSFFSTPNWSNILNKDVWIIAVTLALVASLETLLSIEAIDDLDPYQRVTNKERELKAQGVGNMLSGLIGGLPLTSVIVRSSANVNAGAQSKLSTIFHGLLLLGSVALIPTLLNLIPKAALAAILIATGYKLAKPALFRHFYKMGMNQFIPFVVTIVAILITDLLIGVLIGMAVGLFFVIRSNFRSSVFVVNDESQYLFRLRKDVSFLNKPIVKNRLEEVPENASVLIDVSRADFIDRDVVETIEDFMIHAPLKNITVSIRHSPSRNHGFNEKVRNEVNPMPDLIREHEKNIKVVEPQ